MNHQEILNILFKRGNACTDVKVNKSVIKKKYMKKPYRTKWSISIKCRQGKITNYEKLVYSAEAL